jgi:hypothetical protein
LTVFTNNEGPATKRYSLKDGKVDKTTAAQISNASFETVKVDGLKGFAELLATLKTNQVLTYGLADKPAGQIVTKEKVDSHPGAIARNKEYFMFRPAPGIFMGDYDAEHWPGLNSYGGLRDLLISACPALADAPALSNPSASSNIVNTETGEVINDLKGQRFYIAVKDSVDIPRAGCALVDRLWLIGVGQYVVGKNGNLLERNALDSSVWQGHGLDFAAGAVCDPPMARRPIPPQIWNPEAGLFDTRLILDLTPEEKTLADRNRQKAKDAKREEAAAKRAVYKGKEVERYVDRGVPRDKAIQIVNDAVDNGLLFAEFLLTCEDGRQVTVGEMLDHRERWHGKRFADPMEPEYRGDKRIAWANLQSGGKPYLHSFAHGGKRYMLLRQPSRITIAAGEYPRITDDTLAVFRLHGEVYEFGDKTLARVTEAGTIAPMTKSTVMHYAERVIRYEVVDGRSKDKSPKPANCPERIAQTILDLHGERGLPKLQGVITAPTLRPDGSIFDSPGYDLSTGLFYVSNDPTPPRVPIAPTMAEVHKAFAELWKPFSLFPYDSDQSRGVMLAAILTAATRGTVSPAPGFGFDAPTAGSGKSLLAKCLMALTGTEPIMNPPPPNDTEGEKRLLSLVKDGAAAICWDNYNAPVDGASLNAFLTADPFAGRLLGESSNPSFPNKALFLVTGNNLRIQGDTCRRVLVCRIDDQSEQPYLREFNFEPLTLVKSRRASLIVAALTLIRGALTHTMAGIWEDRLAPGRFASYEAWDDLVRQTVVWLNGEGVTFAGEQIAFSDPAGSAINSFKEDPAKNTVGLMLAAWFDAFDAVPTYAGEFMAKLNTAHGKDGFTSTDTPKTNTDTPVNRPRILLAVEALEANGKPLTPQGLGQWLTKHRGEVVDGKRFASEDDSHGKQKKWFIESMEAKPSPHIPAIPATRTARAPCAFTTVITNPQSLRIGYLQRVGRRQQSHLGQRVACCDKHQGQRQQPQKRFADHHMLFVCTTICTSTAERTMQPAQYVTCCLLEHVKNNGVPAAFAIHRGTPTRPGQPIFDQL